MRKRLAYGGAEAAKISLDQVVGRAFLETLHRRFLADGAGDEEEGCTRAQLAHDSQGRPSREAGEGIVAEHDVGTEARHGIAEPRLRRNVAPLEDEPCVLEAVALELHVETLVLDEKYPQRGCGSVHGITSRVFDRQGDRPPVGARRGNAREAHPVFRR